MNAPDSTRLEVGWIGKPHGLRGEVHVRLSTDREERAAQGSVLYTHDRRLVVDRSRPAQSNWVVLFEGIDDRESAEALRGSILHADPIEDDSAIWVHDLIGSKIQELDGTPRGRVEAVQQNPASDLLVTDTGALVPLTFYVEHGDGVVVVDPPAGLFDLFTAN